MTCKYCGKPHIFESEYTDDKVCLEFKEYEEYIEIIDIDNNKHKICYCDCIYVEWLMIRYLKIDRDSLK